MITYRGLTIARGGQGRGEDGWKTCRLAPNEDAMIILACLCGQTRIQLEKRPDYIHECNCVLCSKTGARWGYFHPSEVTVEGRGKGYCRDDKDDPKAEVRFCPDCGVTTHFVLTESAASKFGNGPTGNHGRARASFPTSATPGDWEAVALVTELPRVCWALEMSLTGRAE